jgi:ribonuclease P protein component
MNSDTSFRQNHRLRKQADFERVYQARVYAADDVLVVNGNRNGLEHPRLGLSISAKVGKATVRNRWKRLIREAFRLGRGELPAGVDLVVRPQKGAEAELELIRRSLRALARRVAKRLEGKTSRTEEPKNQGQRETSRTEEPKNQI